MKKLLCVLAAGMMLVACGKKEETPAEVPAEVFAAELVVWCEAEDVSAFEERAAAFKEQNPDREYTIAVQAESLDTVCETVLTDPSAAADLFAFPEDQGDVLMEGGGIIHREDGIYGVLLKDGVLIGLNPNCAYPEEAEKLAFVLAGHSE